MSPKSRLLRALKLERVDRVPVVNIFQTATVEQMEACGAFWPEAHRDSLLMARLALAAHDVAQLECVRLPFSPATEASAFGCRIDWGDKRLFPQFFPVDVREDEVDRLEVPKPNSCGVVTRAVEALKGKAKDTLPIIVGVQGPFTLASMILGGTKIFKVLKKNPKFIYQVLQIVSSFLASYAATLSHAGADVVALIECSGSGLMLGASDFKLFVQPYLMRVADSIHVPVILHVAHSPRLIEKPLKELLAETKIAGFCLEWGFSVEDTRELVGEKTALVGNLDPVKLLSGTVEEVEEHAKQIIDAGIDVLSGGCDFPPDTPTANIRALLRAAQRYGFK